MNIEPGEPYIVFCVLTNMQHVERAKRGTCAECGQAIWIAPSTQVLLRKHPQGRTVCIDCMPSIIAQDKGKYAGLIEGQAAEIVEHIKKEDAARNN